MMMSVMMMSISTPAVAAISTISAVATVVLISSIARKETIYKNMKMLLSGIVGLVLRLENRSKCCKDIYIVDQAQVLQMLGSLQAEQTGKQRKRTTRKMKVCFYYLNF